MAGPHFGDPFHWWVKHSRKLWHLASLHYTTRVKIPLADQKISPNITYRITDSMRNYFLTSRLLFLFLFGSSRSREEEEKKKMRFFGFSTRNRYWFHNRNPRKERYMFLLPMAAAISSLSFTALGQATERRGPLYSVSRAFASNFYGYRIRTGSVSDPISVRSSNSSSRMVISAVTGEVAFCNYYHGFSLLLISTRFVVGFYL